MKAIDLPSTSLSLADVLQLAGDEQVLLRIPDGREYLLTEIDEFDEEVARTCQNEELMQFLAERSKDTTRYTLDEVKRELGLD